MIRRTTKGTRKDPEQALADLGPLQWLVAFANIGVDGQQALGPYERLMDSRFLGQDGTHRGYVLDPKQPKRIVEHSDPRGKEIIQERRGVLMRWWQGPDDPEPMPFPYSSPLQARGVVTWEWLMEQFPPPREVMPKLASRYGVRPSPAPALGEPPDWLEPAIQCFADIQREMRFFLEALWYATRCSDRAPKSARGRTLFEEIVDTFVSAITNCCADPRPTPPPKPPDAQDELTRTLLRRAWEIADTVWNNRAPIWTRASDQVGSPPIFVSDNPGGIAWAEVLNAASIPAAWSTLRFCGCGRFWIAAAPASPGRRRESCGLCRVPFSDYGFADRLSPRLHLDLPGIP